MYKAPRSIHPECVGQLASDALKPSLEWLNKEKVIRRGTDLVIMNKALAVLGTSYELMRDSS